MVDSKENYKFDLGVKGLSNCYIISYFFLSVVIVMFCLCSIKFLCEVMKELQNAKNIYFLPVCALFSPDNSHCQMISTTSVFVLLFASTMLLSFKRFPTRPGYATNCKLVPISLTFLWLFLILLYFLG